jgi:hypothetical protein
MGRIRDSIIRKYKKAVDKSRDALGSPITVYYRTGDKISPPTGVVWDPVNLESMDPNAPSLSGNLYLDEIANKTINANISWVGMSNKYQRINLAGGELDNTDVYITCKLADILIDPASTSGDTMFQRCIYVDINGKKVYPKTTTFSYGLAGELYSCAGIFSLDKARSI